MVLRQNGNFLLCFPLPPHFLPPKPSLSFLFLSSLYPLYFPFILFSSFYFTLFLLSFFPFHFFFLYYRFSFLIFCASLLFLNHTASFSLVYFHLPSLSSLLSSVFSSFRFSFSLPSFPLFFMSSSLSTPFFPLDFFLFFYFLRIFPLFLLCSFLHFLLLFLHFFPPSFLHMFSFLYFCGDTINKTSVLPPLAFSRRL
jgi:hypothetical protein